MRAEHETSTEFFCQRGELRETLSLRNSDFGDVKWTREDESTATACWGFRGHGTTAAVLYCGRPAHLQHASTKTWRHGVNGLAVTSRHTGASCAVAKLGDDDMGAQRALHSYPTSSRCLFTTLEATVTGPEHQRVREEKMKSHHDIYGRPSGRIVPETSVAYAAAAAAREERIRGRCARALLLHRPQHRLDRWRRRGVHVRASAVLGREAARPGEFVFFALCARVRWPRELSRVL